MAAGTITGHAGTRQGRIVQVERSPHFVHVGDPATPHSAWVLNLDQAKELAEALLRAVNR